MNYRHLLGVLTLSLSLVGCTVISGFQTYDLPKEGIYKTELGTQVNIVKLTQDTLPAEQPTQIHGLKNYAFLFQNSLQNYRLSPGDILSLQLWAYPEITPPIQDISNVKAAGYPIDSSGNVQLPLIGQVRVAGKTLAETNRFLHSQFARYLKHPDVVVRVLANEGRRYFVNGQVMRSGQ